MYMHAYIKLRVILRAESISDGCDLENCMKFNLFVNEGGKIYDINGRMRFYFSKLDKAPSSVEGTSTNVWVSLSVLLALLHFTLLDA